MIEINSYKMNAMICDSIEGDVGHICMSSKVLIKPQRVCARGL